MHIERVKIVKKKLIIVIVLIVSILIGAGYGVGNYFVNYALSPYSDSEERNVDEDDKIEKLEGIEKIISENRDKEDKKGEEFEKLTSSAQILSNDNLKLKGKYITQGKNNHKWVILIHGYKSSNKHMMSYGAKYYEKGYNVLLPNNRAHGDSEGDYIGMGWLDKDDIVCWIDWISKNDSNAKIILHGVSMGAATTMMASGDNLNNVVGYIEDCGYTSVWDIFASELDRRFSLPTFPVLDISVMVANMKAGYNFKDASSVKQVAKCKEPMMFIHGGKDDFVPTDMVYEVYDAAKCKKDLYLVKEAGHAEAKDYDPDAYWNEVFDFIDKNIRDLK